MAPVSQCRAAHCPEDNLPDDYVFCWVHWDLLPQALKEMLVLEAYGEEDWPIALDECIRALRRIEGYTQPRERD